MEADPLLERLGVRPGEQVRFLPLGRGRPEPAVITGAERDGSLAVVDADGGHRSLPVDRVEVRRSGPRGGRAWEPLAARVERPEQLRLLD